MKLSFKNKITLGFVINIVIVLATGIVYLYRIERKTEDETSMLMDWVVLALIVISLVLLGVVFVIIRNQVSARNEANKLLLDNKQLLQSIIDNTTNPIFIKKLNGEYLLVNKQYGELFGLSMDDIIGKTDNDFLSPENARVMKDSDLSVLKEDKEVQVEEILDLPDGQHTYIAVKFPLHDSNGRIYAVGGISTEISARKQEEESMKAGDRFFKMSLDILVIANELKFIKINPALGKILGYSDKELMDQPFTTFIHPEDIEKTGETIGRLKQGAQTVNFENRWICKDGSVKWLSWTAASDHLNGEPVFYAVAHDITDKKEVLATLKTFEQFFKMSFDMMVVANDKFFIKANPAYTRILGYEQSELGVAPFLSFIHPDDKERAVEEVDKLIKGTTMINFRARVRCKDKSYKWLEWNATTDLQTGLVYGVARDVSEQVKLEEEEYVMVQQLYEREQRLRLILENIGDGVLVVNKDGKVVMANYYANALYQNDVDEEINADLSELYQLYYPDEQTVFPSQNLPIERALNGEVTEDIDVVVWDPQNQIKRRVLMSGRPIIDQQNNVIAAVVTIKDISRYKQMEEELMETKRKYRRAIGFRSDKQEEEQEEKATQKSKEPEKESEQQKETQESTVTKEKKEQKEPQKPEVKEEKKKEEKEEQGDKSEKEKEKGDE